jgi:hypothetical protein
MLMFSVINGRPMTGIAQVAGNTATSPNPGFLRKLPLRVAALRLSSREIVDASHPEGA